MIRSLLLGFIGESIGDSNVEERHFKVSDWRKMDLMNGTLTG